MTELQKRDLLALDHSVPGMPPIVQLLKEDGSKKRYSIPGAKKGGEPIELYFRIPKSLWTSGIIREMSGPALAMYLVVLSVARSDEEEQRVWFSPSNFKERFGLGESTRKTGLKELVDLDILTEQVESIDASGGTDNRTFRRKTYTLEPRFAL